VGVAKVVAKLGPRGTLNMGSHILARAADGVRAQAARLNPDQQHDDVDEVLARLEMINSSSSSSGSSAASDTGRDERGHRVLPVVALGVAMVQILLNAVAGESGRLKMLLLLLLLLSQASNCK
jgi:hypothetical protein